MNILEQKRKLLGHTYMGGGGGGGGRGGGGGDGDGDNNPSPPTPSPPTPAPPSGPPSGPPGTGPGDGDGNNNPSPAPPGGPPSGNPGNGDAGDDGNDPGNEDSEAADPEAETPSSEAPAPVAPEAPAPITETPREIAPAPVAPEAPAPVTPETPAPITETPREVAPTPVAPEAPAPVAPEAPAPITETPREVAPAPVAPEAPALSDTEKEKQDNIAREQAAANAAKAEADRVAAEQAKAAASLNEAAVVNKELSPLSDVSLSDKQEAALAKTEQVNALREQANQKLSSYYGKDANKYATTADKDPNAVASVYKDLMGEVAYQKMMLGGGKQNPDGREVTIDVPANSFVDVFGRPPTYAEAKALQAVGLGNITGVNANNLTATNVPVQGVEGLFTNEPGQTADSIVATTDFVNFMTPIAKAAAMMIPGMSLAMTIKDLYEGNITLGDVTSNFALGLLAKQLGINVNVARAMINGDFGSALSSTLLSQLNPALAKELGINPALASILGKESGAYGALTKAFSGLNQNWGTSKDISNAINSGFQNIGITTGTGGTNGATGQAINLGLGTQDAIDHYLGSGGGGSGANTPTPTPTTPSITAPTTPTTPTTPSITAPTTPGGGTTGTGASTINTQGNLFNPMGLTTPQTQQMVNAFPQLANVFYYGKDTGSKKQKLDENNQLVFDESDQGLASGGRIADNKDDAIDAYIRHIVEQSGGPMSQRELLAIVKGL